MMKSIGIDVHAATCSLVALDDKGNIASRAIVETSAQPLIHAVKGVQGIRRVCIEECNLSGWVYDVLNPHVDELVVTRIDEKRKGRKDDFRDALDLAHRIRNGNVVPVYKPQGEFRRLKQLARSYRFALYDHVRTMNRLKALYQSQGIFPRGTGVYLSERAEWFEKLSSCRRTSAELILRQHDALKEIRHDVEVAMLREARKHPIHKILCTGPGLGEKRVAQLMPIVINPHRFRTCRQFWSYSGLGIIMRSSSDWSRGPDQGWIRENLQKTRGLNKKANRVLKDIFKGAANTIVKNQTGPLFEHYCRLTDGQTKPNLARLTVARKVAAITLAMWKNQETYNPTKLNNP